MDRQTPADPKPKPYFVQFRLQVRSISCGDGVAFLLDGGLSDIAMGMDRLDDIVRPGEVFIVEDIDAARKQVSLQKSWKRSTHLYVSGCGGSWSCFLFGGEDWGRNPLEISPRRPDIPNLKHHFFQDMLMNKLIN